MSSPWAIPQHGVDVGGYIPNGGGPPSPIGGGASSPGGASNKSRRSIANWFSRSRSTSPAAAEDNNGRYSRQASPTSFVVRSVVKQPGGVSYESSNRSPGPHSPGYQQQQQGGEDYISSQQHNAAYSRERSRPLHSLSVPAGGPGGGTGYGTATSSNDGRPLIEQQEGRMPPMLNGTSNSPQTSPGRGRSIDRPASPGAISAGAFRRGRSGSNTNTGGTPSALVPGQGAGGGKPAATMISPGPQSWRQAAEARESERATSSSSSAAPRNSSTSPGGPRQNPNNNNNTNRFSMMNHADRKPSPIDTNMNMRSNGDYHEAMRARIAQAGGAMPLDPSAMATSTRTPPAVIPVPIDMPATNSNNTRRPSPHAYEHSPLGPSSPARNNNNGGRRTSFGAGTNEDEGMVSPATQWIKGLFSKSPRQSQSPSPSPGTSPMPYATRDGLSPAPTTPYAWTDGSPLAGPRKSNQTQKYDHDEDEVVLRGDGDEVEAEALARKRHSMRIAARIEDEHRNRLMQGGGIDAGNNNNLPKPWSPRQAIDSGDEDEQHSLPKSRSPPGRKPVPKLEMEPTAEELRRMSLGQRERVAKGVDPENQLSKQADITALTPAQQIIAETRSRHLSRERQEQQQQVQQHKTDPSSSSSQRHPPTLPSKSPHPSVRRANEERSEQPQQQSTPVKGKSVEAPATASTSKVIANNGLLPGQGPMPSSMPMGEALQEMMVRFYRFERYAVPLMRAIEGRVLDIEKDAQMAQNAAAAGGLAADDSRSAKSARDAEMDKWVGQMTGLIKHEIGQLRAATAELRGGRELLAAAAGIGGGVDVNASVSPNAKAADTAKPSAATVSATEAATSEQKPQSTSPMKSGEAEKDNRRHNNISSTSFISAVPRRGSMQRQQEVITAKLDGVGARPVSPSGRPRYTSALGQPLQNGRLSPVRGGSTSSRIVSPAEQNDEDDDGKSDVSSASRAQSIDERLKALVNNKIRTPSSQTSSSDAVMVEHDDAASSSGMNRTSSDADGFALVSHKDEDEDDEPHTPLRRNRQKEASAVSAKSEATFVPSSNVTFPSPSPSPSDIQTSGFASQGLRARAQSYLQHAESRSSLSNSSSSLVSTPRSPAARSKEPSPSPAPPNESDWLARKKSAASSTSSSSTRPLTIKKSVNSLSSASATSPVKESFGSTLNSRKVAGPEIEQEEEEEEQSENGAGQATIRAKKSPVSSAFLNHKTSSTLLSSPKKRTPILTSSSSPATTPGGTTSFRDRIAFFDAAAR